MESTSANASLTTMSPAPSTEGFLGQLPDTMIEEILVRLPLSSVFGSRCVSKLWLSLTTSPYFIRRWELHQAPLRKDPPLGLLIQNFDPSSEREFLLCSGATEIKFSGFCFDFLSGFRLNGNDPFTVMGSCEDLLLCCNRERFQRDYFVVNPITRQWVALPPTLRRHSYVLTGLACDPASIQEAREGGELRYRVVRIPVFRESKTEFNVEIFSSEDGQWNEYEMTLAEGLEPHMWKGCAVAYNGNLYWEFNVGLVEVMRMDPFNPKKKGIRVIRNAPKRLELQLDIYKFGISGGKLRMCEVLWFECSDGIFADDKEALQMNMWELEEEKDEEEARWRLVRVVPMQEMLAANSSIVERKNALASSLAPLALDPSDGDIIYFICDGMRRVICCNMKRMSLEIVGGCDLDEWFDICVESFTFQVPCWPTPVPALPNPCS